MTTYTAKDGERLDSIVYAHYGTNLPEGFAQALPQVVAVNAHLPAILNAGDKVLLPDLDIPKQEAKLW
jgi:phage tail protein X